MTSCPLFDAVQYARDSAADELARISSIPEDRFYSDEDRRALKDRVERFEALLIHSPWDDIKRLVSPPPCAGSDDDVCRCCGDPYSSGGDGYDGMCPTCADKAEKEEG